MLLISGGTYAYWSWASNTNKTVAFNTVASLKQYIEYDAGESHFAGNFGASSDYCNNAIYNTITFNKTASASEMVLVATINMDINRIENAIKNYDSVYWVLIEGDKNDCTGNLSDALAYGSFKGKSTGSFKMLEYVSVMSTPSSYTTYIWVKDSPASSSLNGATIDVNIWTQIDQAGAMYGDADLDGQRTIYDATVILQYAEGTTTLSDQAKKNADVNADGVVDSDDSSLLLDVITDDEYSNIGASLYSPLS